MNKFSQLKICVEASCEQIFKPDHSGKCPKCGSESLWLNKTVIGGINGLAKKVEEFLKKEETQ